MTKEELLARLASIEWDDFEVKESRNELPKSIWETVSAFANTVGGWIVLGVSQTGQLFEVTGINNAEKMEQDFYAVIRGRQKFNVPVDAQIEKFDVEGKCVFAVHIPASEQKPVYFNAPQNTFIRTGSGDQRASEYERNAMFRNQSYGLMSDKAVPDTSFEDLNKDSFNSYRRFLKDYNPTLKYNEMNDAEFCKRLRITNGNELTNGGLLMFGGEVAIAGHFSDFRIDFLEIPGTSYANATARYTFRIPELENIWEYYLALIQRLRLYADNELLSINSMGAAIDDTSQLDALREALVNMLMHADYFSPMKSRIRVFDDRIEFENAGGFPRTIEELLNADITIPRNPVIAKLFRCARLCETAGYGFDKMLLWQKKGGLKVHFFDDKQDMSKVVFERVVAVESSDNVTDNVTDNVDRMDKIIKLLDKKPNISTNELAIELSVTKRTILRDIAKLKEIQKIQRIGKEKSGYWIVKKEHE